MNILIKKIVTEILILTLGLSVAIGALILVLTPFAKQWDAQNSAKIEMKLKK